MDRVNVSVREGKLSGIVEKGIGGNYVEETRRNGVDTWRSFLFESVRSFLKVKKVKYDGNTRFNSYSLPTGKFICG